MILCVCVLILHEKGDHSVWFFLRNILPWFYLILIFNFPDILEGNGLREAFNALKTVNRDRGYFWSLCEDYVTCFTICGIAEKIFLALMSASLGVPKYHSDFSLCCVPCFTADQQQHKMKMEGFFWVLMCDGWVSSPLTSILLMLDHLTPHTSVQHVLCY